MRYFFLIFLALWVTPSLAEKIIVKTGEHGGFTRIAFHHEVGDHPRFSQISEGVYAFTFEGGNREVDLDAFFERLHTGRVSSIVWEGKLLRLTVGCKCEISRHSLNGRITYFDISEVDSPSSSVDVGIPDLAAMGFREKLKPTRRGGVAETPENNGFYSTDLNSLGDDSLLFVTDALSVGVSRNLLTASVTNEGNRQVGDTMGGFKNIDSSLENIRNYNEMGTRGVNGTPRVSFCSLVEPLRQRDASLSSKETLAQLHELRSGILDNSGVVNEGRYFKVAFGYLSIGFFEEASQMFLELDSDLSILGLELLALLGFGDGAGFPLLNKLRDCGEEAEYWLLLGSYENLLPLGENLLKDGALYFKSFPEGVREIALPRIYSLAERSGFGDILSYIGSLENFIEDRVRRPDSQKARSLPVGTFDGLRKFDEAVGSGRSLGFDDRLTLEGIAFAERGTLSEIQARRILRSSFQIEENWIAFLKESIFLYNAMEDPVDKGMVLEESFQVVEGVSAGDFFGFMGSDQYEAFKALLSEDEREKLSRKESAIFGGELVTEIVKTEAKNLSAGDEIMDSSLPDASVRWMPFEDVLDSSVDFIEEVKGALFLE